MRHSGVYGLYALWTTCGHAPDKSVDGVLGGLFPDLDQDTSEVLGQSGAALGMWVPR